MWVFWQDVLNNGSNRYLVEVMSGFLAGGLNEESFSYLLACFAGIKHL